MKITKRQLRRIIRESLKSSILKENVVAKLDLIYGDWDKVGKDFSHNGYNGDHGFTKMAIEKLANYYEYEIEDGNIDMVNISDVVKKEIGEKAQQISNGDISAKQAKSIAIAVLKKIPGVY